MRTVSANPAVNRRETQLRLRAVEEQLDKILAMERGEAKASPLPAFTDSDVEEVGRMLVEGRIKLPAHTRLTVITTVEEVRHKLFNTTTDVITHTADQLHVHRLRPFTVLEVLEAGLIRRLPSGWAWSEVAYERLASAN
jgi:hypothetical protein